MPMPITVLDGATRLPAQRYLRRGVEALCLNDNLATGLVGLKGGRTSFRRLYLHVLPKVWVTVTGGSDTT